MVRVFANGPGDLGSIPGQVIPKTQKMVLNATLLNTQHYKVRIKGKVEQSRERSSVLPLHLGVAAIKKGAFGSPLTTVANFTYLYRCMYIDLYNHEIKIIMYLFIWLFFLISFLFLKKKLNFTLFVTHIYTGPLA